MFDYRPQQAHFYLQERSFKANLLKKSAFDLFNDQIRLYLRSLFQS